MKIELPKDWNSVTIDQFQKLSKIKYDEVDGIDNMIELISVLSGVERQKLYDVAYCDIIKIWNVIGWISEFTPSDKIIAEFTLKDITYVANLDVRKMTANQVIDLKSLQKDGLTIDNMHMVLAIFYIPKGKKYNQDEDLVEISEVFRNELSIAVAYPLQVFFCKRFSKWKSLSEDSMKKSLMTKKKKNLMVWLTKKQHSMSSGVGS